MIIERANILELIGTGKNKYHSCVITSYSMDLSFFEHLVLPKLKAAGVTNINVFVDAAMLEKYLGSHTAYNHINYKVNYSITPMDKSGAFHPKMMFLAGKTRGYLSIGSGNITSSGMLYNDEIWASFYLANDKLKAQPIFKQAWNYIQDFVIHSHSINRTKIQWIEQHAKWIQSLDKTDSLLADFDKDSYQFHYTKSTDSLYNEVFGTIQKQPESIKVVAPYYNKSGAFIDRLIKDLQPKDIHCIVDTSHGSLPIDFKLETCQFSDWSQVIEKDDSDRINKLHAKAVQIEYKDYTLFILGSANATLEAFGISDRKVKNDEAVVVLKTIKPRDFFAELGVDIPKLGTLKINELKTLSTEEKLTSEKRIKLRHAETKGLQLLLFLDKNIDKSVVVKLYSADNRLLEEIPVVQCSKEIIVNIKNEVDLFKVALYDDKSEERLTTFAIVQKNEVLQKSNPDERLAKLQSFEHLDIFNALDYELVLNFLEDEKVLKEGANTFTSAPVKNVESDNEGEILSENEYNKRASLTLEDQVTSETITSMVEEFLDVLKIRDSNEELSDNNEELAIDAGDDGVEELPELKTQTYTVDTKEGERIQRKINKTLLSVCDLISKRIDKNRPLDERTLNAFYIGCHILIHFWNEGYNEEICKIKIRYQQLDELSKLERNFKLKRTESQVDSVDHEVSYYIDVTRIQKLQFLIENSKGAFKITEKPSEPIMVNHSFITIKHVSDLDSTSVLSMVIKNALCPILLALKENHFHIKLKDKIKLLILADQLLSTATWSSKMIYFKDLLYLNMFELLAIENKEAASYTKHLSKNSNEMLSQYLSFKSKLEKNEIESVPLENHMCNNLIYSTQLGFCKLKTVRSNLRIDLESPIGKTLKNCYYSGFYKVFIGKKVKVYY
ncbi:hypothetical protein HNV08_05635 [Winogradskyella eckloniae]|uniref:hypothetical protein n=1 Tax=Winogradskyella eckloniae TaxID=1089306 RepID=UPI001567B0EC|nr:hypothetical protein [Winogradskyella eckloniae]NRD19520.1 hypothetical protein [Winogradskyella eckloniae]